MEPRHLVGPSVRIQLRRRWKEISGKEWPGDDDQLSAVWLEVKAELGVRKRIPNNRLEEAYTKTLRKMGAAMSIAKHLIREIPDYPKPGIIFRDITPLLNDGAVFRAVVSDLAQLADDLRPELIAGIEARGFIFGAAIAAELGIGFVPIRKAGKLPHKTASESYVLEYGTAEIEVHEDSVKPGQRVVLVDDLIATGGTALAAVCLFRRLQVYPVGMVALIDLVPLDGAIRLMEEGLEVKTLVQY